VFWWFQLRVFSKEGDSVFLFLLLLVGIPDSNHHPSTGIRLFATKWCHLKFVRPCHHYGTKHTLCGLRIPHGDKCPPTQHTTGGVPLTVTLVGKTEEIWACSRGVGAIHSVNTMPNSGL